MRLDVEDGSRNEVGKHPIAVNSQHGHACGFGELHELFQIEPAMQTIGARRGLIGKDALRGVKAPGKHPAEDRSRPVCREHAEQSARPQCHSGSHDAGRWVIGDLENVMTQQDIDLLRINDLPQSVEITLAPADALGDPGLGSAALEGSQRVRARVDDDDLVAELRQRNREPAATATGINDGKLMTSSPLGKLLERTSQVLPDDAAARRRPRAGLARLTGRHACLSRNR